MAQRKVRDKQHVDGGLVLATAFLIKFACAWKAIKKKKREGSKKASDMH